MKTGSMSSMWLFSVFTATAQAMAESRTMLRTAQTKVLLRSRHSHHQTEDHVKIAPGWQDQTTAAPSAAWSSNASGGLAGATPATFDARLQQCTPILNVPGTFVANKEYWKEECKSIPTSSKIIRIAVGDTVDFYQPLPGGTTVCDMLASGNKHLWSNDGTTWRAPNASAVGLGGSADGWLASLGLPIDKRSMPSFWGVDTSNATASSNLTGGCCTDNYSGVGKSWGKAFKMEYCGPPPVLAPICTPMVTVPSTFSADKAYWTEECKKIPLTTSFIKIAMGTALDYYRPPAGKSYCEMLTEGNIHEWSLTGDTWAAPTYAAAGLGGSAQDGVNGTAGNRKKVSFWGSDTATDTGGCCYNAADDASPGFGKAFTMSFCEVPTVKPMNQLVASMRENEASVVALEQELGALHTRLFQAESRSVLASGNVSLATSGMYKLAVRARSEADSLENLQQRTAFESTNLDQVGSQLKGAGARMDAAKKTVDATAAIAGKEASVSAMSAQEKLNDRLFNLMDPSNPNSLEKSESTVSKLEKKMRKFKKALTNEIKLVLTSRMRKDVDNLRDKINALGSVGQEKKVAFGAVESSAPLGADLGLDD